MNSPIRLFCSANTCSTRERIFDFALLARCIVSGIARPFGFLGLMWLTKPFLFRNVSLACCSSGLGDGETKIPLGARADQRSPDWDRAAADTRPAQRQDPSGGTRQRQMVTPLRPRR